MIWNEIRKMDSILSIEEMEILLTILKIKKS